MFKISGNNIYLTRGDSAAIELQVVNGETPYDFSEDEVKFSLKKRLSDKQPLIQKTFGNYDSETDKASITIEPEDTAGLDFGDYLYDIQLKHTEEPEQEGDEPVVTVDTIIVPSTFTIGAEVTD